MMTLRPQPTRASARNQHPQRGFTLIEVLVSLLIFSFGLLGFVGLQARAVGYASSAEDQNRAALLASELAATMLGAQTVLLPSGVTNAWIARVADPSKRGLPNGIATVEPVGNFATITITWHATTAASGAANSVNKYVTNVILP